MQLIRYLILLFCIGFIQPLLRAQVCLDAPKHTIYFNKNTHESLAKTIFFTGKDSMYIAGSVNTPLNGKNNNDIWIMLNNPKGTPVWSKAIGTGGDETVNVIKQTPDGGYIIAGNTTYNAAYSQGWIAKLDHDCKAEWSYVIGGFSTLSNITRLSDGGYAACGEITTGYKAGNGNIVQIYNSSNLVMRIDSTGRLMWYKAFRHTDQEALRPVIQMSDLSLLVVGSSVSTTAAAAGYMIKLDINNGNIIWMNAIINPEDRTYPSPVEREDGTIQLYLGNKIFNFDSNGRSTGINSINLNNDSSLSKVSVSRFGPNVNGQDVYFANFAAAPVVFSVKNDSEVVWSRSYNPYHLKSISLRSGKIRSNHIYLTGIFTGDKISDNEEDDALTYIVKADADGYTSCSDTFGVKFNISHLPPQPNINYSWMNDGTIQMQKINLTTTDLLPAEITDCSINTCCRDTLMYKDTLACSGSSFMLANGTAVNKDGVYSVIYQSAKGCDSAVYTSVKFVQPYPFTLLLGNDTCLINNQPVKFTVAPVSNIQYKWQDGSAGSSFIATKPGWYYVTAQSVCNSFTDSVEVKQQCEYPVFIPNSFTPNHDGLNDYFRIPVLNGQQLVRLNIYNRYGNLVFSTSDASTGWDGNMQSYPQPAGTYVYAAVYKDFAGRPHYLKGTVVLIR